MKTERIAWIDIARGASIVMVVAYHATLYLNAHAVEVGVYLKMNDLLQPIRMPLFFAASGILAAKSMDWPWGDFIRRRIWLLAYLLTLWVAIRWVFFGFVHENVRAPEEGHSLIQIAQAWYWPLTGIWFLWALVVFNLIAKPFRGPLRPVIVAIAAAISMLAFAGVLNTGNFAFDKALSYAVFFLTGAYYPTRLMSAVSTRPFVLAGVGACAFGFLTVLAIYALPSLTGVVKLGLSGVVLLVQAAAGVCLAFASAAVASSSFTLVKIFGDILGKNTLPIYVAHVMIAAAAAAIWAHFVPESELGSWLSLPVIVFLAICLSLAIENLLRLVGAQFFYTAPGSQKRPATA